MKPTRVSAWAFAVAASLAGCTATGDVEYAGAVRVTSPDLITISPGVQVIADSDEPLFYVNSNYWLYRDGYWFRSDNYRSGFARVDFVYVPRELRVIDRPQLYVQYRRHIGRSQFAVSVTSPELVTISPGVQVIADADEPLFYVNGFYWLYRDGIWLRSDNYRSGFARIDITMVPGELRVIDRPQAYVQYRRQLGRDRFARPGQQPTRSPTYPSQPAPTQPNRPQPMQTPDYDRTPPGQNRPVTPPAPDDRGNRPEDRGNRPEDRGNRPDDKGNRPEDKGNRPEDKGNPPAPEDRSKRPEERGRSPNDRNDQAHEHETPQDRDDRRTPPSGQNKPDKDKKKKK